MTNDHKAKLLDELCQRFRTRMARELGEMEIPEGAALSIEYAGDIYIRSIGDGVRFIHLNAGDLH